MICISPRLPLTPSLLEANVMRCLKVQSYPGPLFFLTTFLVLVLASTPALFAQTQAPGAVGNLTAMNICFSNPPPFPSDPNHKTEYLTAVFEVDVNTLRATPVLEPAFSAYLKATYGYPSAGITCQPIWTIADAQTAQKKIASARDSAKLKMIDTGWRYGQPALASGQSGFDPLVLGAGGLDLTQHRLTTYFCALIAPGGATMAVDQTKQNWNANQTRYVSPIFQADWDSAAVDKAFDVYIRDHYVHDLDLTDHSTRCSGQSPAMQAMLHTTALRVDTVGRHVVPVDWTDTPAQAAAANAATASAAAAAQATAAHPAAPFISCSTSGGGGFDIYVTGIFQTTKPVRHLPNGARIVDQSVLDDFNAYLTQKGYKFKPGSNQGCDVSTSEAAAQTAQQTRIHGGPGSCGFCGNKVVETWWKDQ